jgi:hypothetical protein
MPYLTGTAARRGWRILDGKFNEVSLERPKRFLTALGYHIEIKVGAKQANKTGEVTITDAGRPAA